MHLQLGHYGFDVSTRALVVAAISAADLTGDPIPAVVHNIIAERPAILMITDIDNASAIATLERAAQVFAGPIGLRTSDATLAELGCDAGVSMVHDPEGLADPGFLRAIEPSRVGLMISAPPAVESVDEYLAERAQWAIAHGIDHDRLMLQCAAASLPAVKALGFVVAVQPTPDAAEQGAGALAVVNGARLIGSNQVRATRRTIDTVSELLERRETAGAN